MVITKRKYPTKNLGARKRIKTVPRTMVVMKPEMKHSAAVISYSAITFAALPIMQLGTGTSRQSRVGNKIKLHAIEIFLSNTGGAPIRCDLVQPIDDTTTPAYTFAGVLDRSINQVISENQLAPGSNNPSEVWQYYHRFTPPRNVTYKDATLGSCQKGNIHLCLSTPSSATISGYYRLWFTDA